MGRGPRGHVPHSSSGNQGHKGSRQILFTQDSPISFPQMLEIALLGFQFQKISGEDPPPPMAVPPISIFGPAFAQYLSDSDKTFPHVGPRPEIPR